MRRRSSGTLVMFAKPAEDAMVGRCSSSARGRRGSLRRRRARRPCRRPSRSSPGALFENAWAVTVSFLVSSPLPRILMRSTWPLQQPRAAKRLLVDVGARRETLELADVERRRLDGEGIAEAALREAALHRGLTALEVELVDVAPSSEPSGPFGRARPSCRGRSRRRDRCAVSLVTAPRAARAWRECLP